jgi:hypothetical protein
LVGADLSSCKRTAMILDENLPDVKLKEEPIQRSLEK